jgi:osmotically-inducible protein OsmY
MPSKGKIMKSDIDFQNEILDELAWDSRIPDASIAVNVCKGIATLTGHLDTYAEKIAVKSAAEKVLGLHTLILNISVTPPKIHQRTDTEIAAAIEHVFSWSTPVPREKVKIAVNDGWIILDGELDWNFERRAVEKLIRPLKGIVGITNNISLKSHVIPQSISNRIKETLHRQVSQKTPNIDIYIDGSIITLRGQVQSLAEKNAMEGATWSAPGVSKVNSQLTIGL